MIQSVGPEQGRQCICGHLESNRPKYAEILSRVGRLGARRAGVLLEPGPCVGIRKLHVGGRWQRVLPACLWFGWE